jgi:hypothetical protein
VVKAFSHGDVSSVVSLYFSLEKGEGCEGKARSQGHLLTASVPWCGDSDTVVLKFSLDQIVSILLQN